MVAVSNSANLWTILSIEHLEWRECCRKNMLLKNCRMRHALRNRPQFGWSEAKTTASVAQGSNFSLYLLLYFGALRISFADAGRCIVFPRMDLIYFTNLLIAVLSRSEAAWSGRGGVPIRSHSSTTNECPGENLVITKPGERFSLSRDGKFNLTRNLKEE